MKSKELKILRKRLATANRSEDLLRGFDEDGIVLTFEVSENEVETARRNLSILFASSGNITESRIKECLDLFERNMGELYKNSSWGLDMEEKSTELRHDKARFLLLLDDNEKLAGFVHFRFEYDEEESPSCAVLYVYEIQIESIYRRCGIGKRLMGITERIARNESMLKVLLTVFKSNQEAMSFYTKKMGYNIDDTSPTKYGESVDYEILSSLVLPE
ncbi:MAG: ribosomal protein S18 acetylase RimI-like enzyme [Bacillariaceae sp.]|jgi:ribosomal protein S18 acetylase RimI-like enzyme